MFSALVRRGPLGLALLLALASQPLAVRASTDEASGRGAEDGGPLIYLKQDGERWVRVRRELGSVTILSEEPAPQAATTRGAFAFSNSGLFHPYQNYRVGSWPEAVAIGDVNGDGRNDVVMTTSYYFDPANDYKLFVFLQNADGTLATPVKYATQGTYTGSPETVAIGDVNGDGRNDVVVGNSGSAVGVFLQNGSGALDPIAFYPTANSLRVRVADLNNDGRQDVVGIGWGTNTVSVLLQQANGGSSQMSRFLYSPCFRLGHDRVCGSDHTAGGGAQEPRGGPGHHRLVLQ